MRQLRLALAQMNPTVGDLPGNTARILEMMEQARAQGADLVAFPELAIIGYPPEDLLFKRQFLSEAEACLQRIIDASGELTVVVGTPHLEGEGPFNLAAVPSPGEATAKLYNAAAVAHGGRLVGTYHKLFLPNYGIFDEARYFSPGAECPVFTVNGVEVGVNICEDIWYDVGPTTVQRVAGAQVIVNINGSPYHQGRGRYRQDVLAKRALNHGLFIAYVNMVGGQDELVFDGQSLVLDPAGELVARGPQFKEALLVVDVDADAVGAAASNGSLLEANVREIGVPVHLHVSDGQERERPPIENVVCEPLDPLAEVYTALVTGTRDYLRKSGFAKAVVGLSGGIDSALTVAVASDALSGENVTALFMPSRFTSDLSRQDAEAVAANLGVALHVIPIDQTLGQYQKELGALFAGREPDVTEENIQARIRGTLLMAASNKFGWLVLNTGNKSEMATGYCTLYGDMAGGFAVLKDVPKTLVRRLAMHRNTQDGRPVIPESTISRAPTAELRPEQRDEDSLPPYEVLDPILEAYVEDDASVEEMIGDGHTVDAVLRTVRLVDQSEYKRRQAPPGVKITHRAFGRDRRLPIVNRFQPT